MSVDHRYVVTVQHQGISLGAGFLLNRRLVLTAAHCLKRLPRQVKRVDLVVGTQSIRGRIEEIAEEYDVALIRVTGDALAPGVMIPLAGTCHPGDSWFAPFRPSASDPHLDGTVVASSVPFDSAAGARIEALQLECRQHVGDYSGYSGGPVERRTAQGTELVGLLVEQYPDRQQGERAANVLFAATIREALRQLEYLDVAHLSAVLTATNPERQRSPSPGENSDLEGGGDEDISPAEQRALLTTAELKLRALRRWAEEGLLEPSEIPALRVRVARTALSSGIKEKRKEKRGDR